LPPLFKSLFSIFIFSYFPQSIIHSSSTTDYEFSRDRKSIGYNGGKLDCGRQPIKGQGGISAMPSSGGGGERVIVTHLLFWSFGVEMTG